MIFYYDESNNMRSFKLKDGGFNTDTHHNPSPCFVLAGIAIDENGKRISEEDKEYLNKKLNLINNSTELKFKNVAKGDFLDVLRSKKLKSLLEWIEKSDYLIHYYNLNVEYWSIVDIVDDIMDYLYSTKKITVEENNNKDILNSYKDALYILLKINKKAFLKLLEEVSYPKISQKGAKQLVNGLYELCKVALLSSFQSIHKLNENHIIKIIKLKELLKMSAEIESFELVFDTEKGILIEIFSCFYRNRLYNFQNAIHIFDNESQIEERFNSIKKLDDVLKNTNYKFVDSKDYYEIQISDVVSGLFNKYFTFINNIWDIEELEKIKHDLNTLQKENLDLIKRLIIKTSNVDGDMLYMTISSFEYQNYRQILSDVIYI